MSCCFLAITMPEASARDKETVTARESGPRALYSKSSSFEDPSAPPSTGGDSFFCSVSRVSAASSKARDKFHKYPAWSPRFWHGMTFGGWARLVAENRCAVSPSRLPMALLIGLVTPFNTAMGMVQRWRYGRSIRETSIERPPLFVVGHWRSGTTLLHELLVLDEQFTFPTTYQCFAPQHFLLTERIIARYMGFLLPGKRPMDNMAAGWSKPQEDEFALLTLGVRTPYRRMAFPNRPPPDMELLDMAEVDAEALAAWRQALRYFVQALTWKTPKQLVLKSPPHTGRIEELLSLFPGAKFIHIARHPHSIFPSTCRLWKALDDVQGCQRPKHRNNEAYVYECLERMYDGFFRQRELLQPGQIAYVRYEDLVADPVGEIERLYGELALGDFESVRPRIEEQAAARSGYQANVHELAPETEAEIARRWRRYYEAFGYELPQTADDGNVLPLSS